MGFVDPDDVQLDLYHTALLEIPSDFDADSAYLVLTNSISQSYNSKTSKSLLVDELDLSWEVDSAVLYSKSRKQIGCTETDYKRKSWWFDASSIAITNLSVGRKNLLSRNKSSLGCTEATAKL
ncbi:hypothetical protein PVK06_043742 [Gossypium arboreum]|uniref:Uncharacterized protein n=1 Tax=Gossypium arboreum TaxID=29729 RepID=A0ABR0MPP1_GOSAR|nr:hypothetical protein PVK06_043742 [Gossypium arboreum]